MPAGSRIYVTGHSLGGALATIFAAQLLREHGATHAVSLYTFGAPRAGDSEFASAFETSVATTNASATRFHFERDPVVQVPVINFTCSSSAVASRSTPRRRSRFLVLADHEIANYQRSLQRALSQQPAYPMTARGRAAGVTLASASTCAP